MKLETLFVLGSVYSVDLDSEKVRELGKAHAKDRGPDRPLGRIGRTWLVHVGVSAISWRWCLSILFKVGDGVSVFCLRFNVKELMLLPSNKLS